MLHLTNQQPGDYAELSIFIGPGRIRKNKDTEVISLSIDRSRVGDSCSPFLSFLRIVPCSMR